MYLEGTYVNQHHTKGMCFSRFLEGSVPHVCLFEHRTHTQIPISTSSVFTQYEFQFYPPSVRNGDSFQGLGE